MPDSIVVKVVRVRPDPSLLPTGTLERRTTVEFMIGADGPFDVTIPDSEFTAARVQQEMEKKAAEIRKIYGTR
jgi:hypothetical protein